MIAFWFYKKCTCIEKFRENNAFTKKKVKRALMLSKELFSRNIVQVYKITVWSFDNLSPTIFSQKFRQSNSFTKRVKLYCKLIWRKFFEMGGNLRNYHTVKQEYSKSSLYVGRSFSNKISKKLSTVQVLHFSAELNQIFSKH